MVNAITVQKDKFNKVLEDVEILITDVADLIDQDKLAKKRLAEIQASPSIGKSETELDKYLEERGVEVG